MPAPVKDEFGLSQQERRAVDLYLTEGLTKTEAWLRTRSTRAKGLDRKAAAARASLMFMKAPVIAYIDRAMDGMAPGQIIKPARVIRSFIDDQELARAAGNWTAVKGLGELLGKALNLLTDRVLVTEEMSRSDEELIDALALGDPKKAEDLRKILGNPAPFRH